MQFAQDGHSPVVSVSQEAEFRHQMRRLSHHPSIVIITGCNECHVVLNSSTAIYATFVMQTVVEEDISRVVWPSCPSNGWVAGEFVGESVCLLSNNALGHAPMPYAPAPYSRCEPTLRSSKRLPSWANAQCKTSSTGSSSRYDRSTWPVPARRRLAVCQWRWQHGSKALSERISAIDQPIGKNGTHLRVTIRF